MAYLGCLWKRDTMSSHLSNKPRLTRVLIACAAVLGLAACTAAPGSDLATIRHSVLRTA